jgi:inner membrane protein
MNLEWIWVIVGVVLLLGEAAVTTLVLLPMALGAFAAAAVAFAGGGLAWQVAAAVIVATASTFALRPIAKRIRESSADLEKAGPERLEGSHGTVLVAVTPTTEGRVLVEGEEWRAELHEGAPLAEGDRARIIKIVGTRVLVVADPITT